MKAQEVQLTLIPPTYIDLVNDDWEWEWNYPPSRFFLDRELLFIDLKFGTHTRYLKNFHKKSDNFYWNHHISGFFAGNLRFTCFFFFFPAFCKFQCPFYKNIFYLNIYYGNLLLHFGLEGVKIHKYLIKNFFLPTSNLFATQSNPLMALRLILPKTVNENKLKVCKFESHKLSSFSAIKKNITGVEWGRVKLVLFLLLFFACTHISPLKLNSRKSCNYKLIYSFFSLFLFYFSVSCSLIFSYKFNEYE